VDGHRATGLRSTGSPRGPALAGSACSPAAGTQTATATDWTPERRTVLVRAARSRNENLARVGRHHLRAQHNAAKLLRSHRPKYQRGGLAR
jgi:hypothetical protein